MCTIFTQAKKTHEKTTRKKKKNNNDDTSFILFQSNYDVLHNQIPTMIIVYYDHIEN